jgi:hypothetical protein
MTVIAMSKIEVQAHFADKMDNCHPLVADAINNCVGGLQIQSVFKPSLNRDALQSKVQVALRKLAAHPLGERKKGRILGEGSSMDFRLHLSIHQDTPYMVSNINDIWVNYMVTGDMPAERSVGSKLMHKGRVPISKVVSDFSDGLCGIFRNQDQTVKDFIAEINQLVSSNIFVMTKSKLKHHYQTFAKTKNTTSCMSKPDEQYEMGGGHPIDCYEQSPNMALGLMIRPDATFSDDHYSFAGRMFFLHNLEGEFVGRSSFYGNESQKRFIIDQLNDSGIDNTLYGGLLNVITNHDNELMVPYIDVCHQPHRDPQSNRLHWLADLTELQDNNCTHLIDQQMWLEKGKKYLFIGEPEYCGNEQYFHGEASDQGRKVCRLVDVDDAQRSWTDLSKGVVLIYVPSRDESYPEDDVVYSDYSDSYIHEDDVVHLVTGEIMHEDDEGNEYVQCDDSGDNIRIDRAIRSDYHDRWYRKDLHGDILSYCSEEDDYYLDDEEDNFMEYHGYVQVVDIYGDSDWSKNAVFSEFRDAHLDGDSAISTPTNDYIYSEDVIEWLEANDSYEYEFGEFTEKAA